MQPPPDPCGELLRFGAGEQVTEIERVKEILLGNPFSLVHQLAMHQRDLPRRPAKAEQPNARERPQQIDESDSRRGRDR